MKEEYDYLFKILIIGDSNVGKTCILYRLCEESFSSAFISTIGIDFKTKTIMIDNKTVKLQIWDTAGQERFRTITTAYYRGAMGVIIVFDVTNMNSFNDIKDWIQRIREYANNDTDIIVVGNKIDMKAERIVSHEMAEDFTRKYRVNYIDVSAKTGENVNKTFETLAKSIKIRMETNIESSFNKKIGTYNGMANMKHYNNDHSKCC